MCGDFPPNSNTAGIIFLPASPEIRRPTSVPPVKEIIRTRGCVTNASPILLPAPGTTFSTPGGTPASKAILPISIPHIGVKEDGFRPTPFPAASAAAILLHVKQMREFQGVIATTTPQGS